MKLLFSQAVIFLLALEVSPVWPSFQHKAMVDQRRKARSVAFREEEQQECDPHFTCDFESKYRRIDGKCNNIRNPLWGSSLRTFSRYLLPEYEDGVSVSRGEGVTSPFPLPNPRHVSRSISSVTPSPSTSSVSLMAMQWGQFLDHDQVFTPEHEVDCCDHGIKEHDELSDPNCRPIDVTGDSFYDQFGVECLKFTRSVESECFEEHREQINELTSYLDASQVYGSTPEIENQLRSFSKGLLAAGSGSEQLVPSSSCPSVCPYSFLPLNEHPHVEGVDEFIAGDVRVQEQPGLTSMHTIFFRAHNFIATELGKKYGTDDDEFLYQEARRIVGAIVEMITYNEFLPIILGDTYMEEYNLKLPSTNYIYYPSIDASAPNVFATAAFRFGHTFINDTYFLDNAVVELRESFFNHDVTVQFSQYPSDFVRAISSCRAQKYDHFMVNAITNFLYAEPPYLYGSDLMARNIMRARDHGIPPYNEWRKFCGLSSFETFSDLLEVMPERVADAFASVYGRVEDIDLFPALIAESSAPGGGFSGPTLRCLLGRQFFALKAGDRYWFENKSQPVPFTDEQLNAIYNTQLSTVFCKFTNTNDWQRWAMQIPSETNPRLDCDELVKGSALDQISELW